MAKCEVQNYQDVLLHDLRDKLLFHRADEDDQKEDDVRDRHRIITAPNNPRKIEPVLSGNKRAAVLVCIFRGKDDELRVILTKRSMKLSSYPGDVALPGGKMDEIDADDSATALREATEEIGLNPSLVFVLANLEPFISTNFLTVVPVVGVLSRIEDFKPVLNEDEVDAIFDAPLDVFLQENRGYRCLVKEWRELKYACHVFDIETEQGSFAVGGLTASILIRVASIIYQRSPSFSQDLRDFSQLQWSLIGKC